MNLSAGCPNIGSLVEDLFCVSLMIGCNKLCGKTVWKSVLFCMSALLEKNKVAKTVNFVFSIFSIACWPWFILRPAEQRILAKEQTSMQTLSVSENLMLYIGRPNLTYVMVPELSREYLACDFHMLAIVTKINYLL